MGIEPSYCVDALAMTGNSMLLSPERQPIKEIKVQNMRKSSSKLLQPGLLPNSKQNAQVYSLSD